MTSKEIQRIISTKGRAVQDVFNTLVERLNNQIDESDDDYFKDIITDDIIAIISFNTTIRIMQRILDNIDFFKENCTVNERSITRIQKDLKKMSFIEYPPSVSDFNLERYEIGVAEGFDPK